MKLFYDLTVAAAPVTPVLHTLDFKIDKGLIKYCGVFGPPGCHGRVNVKVYFQTHQILPRNQEHWCRPNGDWWGGEMWFPVTAEPLQIKVEAWANVTTYQHVMTIAIELVPWEYVPAWDRLIALLSRMLQFMGAPVPKMTVTERMP